jgi:hypothetical protein
VLLVTHLYHNFLFVGVSGWGLLFTAVNKLPSAAARRFTAMGWGTQNVIATGPGFKVAVGLMCHSWQRWRNARKKYPVNVEPLVAA